MNIHAAQYTPEYSQALDRAAERPTRSARFATGQYVTLVKSIPYHVFQRRTGWVVVRYDQRVKDGDMYPTFGTAMRAIQPAFDGVIAEGENQDD